MRMRAWRFAYLYGGLDLRVSHQPPATSPLDYHHTKDEPAGASNDRAEDIGQIVCSERDSAKPDEGNGQNGPKDGQDSPVPVFPNQNGEDRQ